MSSFEDKVAVVTGAGSGIGRALAVQLAGHGARLALSDVDARGLADTVEQVRKEVSGAEVFAEPVDVADREAVAKHAGAVAERFGVVHQLYNVAGVAYVGPILATPYDELERMMAVNYWGAVHATKEFLPHIIDSGAGHVVTVSSVFGIVAAPWQAAYDASKFAVRGFTEALRGELIAAGHPVRVTCVHPGGVRTSIIANAHAAPGEDLDTVQRAFRRIALTTAEGAARAILRGVRQNRPRVLVGPDARVADVAQRVFGSQYERVAGLVARLIPTANR